MSNFRNNLINKTNQFLSFLSGWATIFFAACIWILKFAENNIFASFPSFSDLDHIFVVVNTVFSILVFIGAYITYASCTPAFVLKNKPKGSQHEELRRQLEPLSAIKRICGHSYRFAGKYALVVWLVVFIISVSADCLPEGSTFISCIAVFVQSETKTLLLDSINNT